MSHSRPSRSSVSARTTRTLVSNTAAALSGKRRGPDRKVRRHSVDVDDPRARVWSRIGDGTKKGGLRWADSLVRTAEEYDLVNKKPGQQGPLLLTGVKVLKALLYGPLDFASGRLEPTIAWIMTKTRLARATVVRALARLKAHGFLDWVRRSRKTGNDGEYGPQREQTSNAYYFDFGRMKRRALLRFEALMRRRAVVAAGEAQKAQKPAPAPTVVNPELAAVLARVGNAICDRDEQGPDASS